eukprot:CAMPEP_0197923472 /NCGR_PEP_ID=MMETSP1439-20131203/94012_1 /TAXON_ID=66791 /ORGANISM="Gonyaulax spinifera, Strain CCMP409" /LENGTH=82 /DNA_ID=CAMNT_0043545841 /DNA_START=85 /DNA_END=330 /DNA_ORIENTATION=+
MAQPRAPLRAAALLLSLAACALLCAPSAFVPGSAPPTGAAATSAASRAAGVPFELSRPASEAEPVTARGARVATGMAALGLL